MARNPFTAALNPQRKTMDPAASQAMELRRSANAASTNATDQYEADVAEFKNIQAAEAEKGIASLPESNSVRGR